MMLPVGVLVIYDQDGRNSAPCDFVQATNASRPTLKTSVLAKRWKS
jgi:hypothetical protein